MKLVVLLLVAAAVAFNDAHLAEDVEAATSRVNVFVNQVRKRAQQYRLRAQKWLKFQEQQQNKFFESEIDRVGDRVGRFLNEEHTDDEQSAFQMAERARVAKAKQDVQQGMHDAGLDVLQGTETAEKDLEAGLNEATADLYRGIEEAKHERAGDVNAVKASGDLYVSFGAFTD